MIIGKVAASRISAEFSDEHNPPPSRVLYGIIDLEPDVVIDIAKQIADIPMYGGKSDIFIHPKIAGDCVDIGKCQLSAETATYHRSNTDDDTVLTVFSVPAEDTSSVRHSLAHVSTINSDWLTDDMELWAKHAMPGANPALHEQLSNVLKGLKRSGIVSEIGVYERFVLEVEKHRTGPEALTVSDAVRRSMPALRLPRNAGDMRADITGSSQKAEAFFKKVFTDYRPALYLRGKDGEGLNPVELRARLKILIEDGDMPSSVEVPLLSLLSNPDVGGDSWLPEQEAVARLSWDEVDPLFSGDKQNKPATFGETTLQHFENNYPHYLNEEQKNMLRNLKRDSATTSEVHTEFFNDHITKLTSNPSLFRRWEKLIFKKTIEVKNLEEGILRLIRQTMQNVGDEQVDGGCIFIRLRKSESLGFWKQDKNTRICRYLRDRYKGLDQLMKATVLLDFGRCWKGWDEPGSENTSESKAARTFEFEAYYVDPAEVTEEKRKNVSFLAKYLKKCPRALMFWVPNPNSIGFSFSDDIQVLAETGEHVTSSGYVPLLTATVAPNRYDKHGSIQTIDLENVSSIKDARSDNNGHLANDNQAKNIISTQWLNSLQKMEASSILPSSSAKKIQTAFEAFSGKYGEAIKAIRSGVGLADSALLDQATLYGELLKILKEEATTPLAIRELWQPLLKIGVAEIQTDRKTVFISGWSPLRLAEMSTKAKYLVKVSSEIVNKYDQYADEIEAYLKDTIRNLSASLYQEACLSCDDKPELLVETVRSFDISLMESPTPDDSVIADEPADDIADSFDGVARDYLKLRPHEKANFSAMLLNSESEKLPVKIAEHMANLMEKEPALRCDLVLTHDDPSQLRRIYEQQNKRIGYEVDSSLTSEAARTFLSRLRVGIISSETLNSSYGKGHDIAILHGVISRKADVKWANVLGVDVDATPTKLIPMAHSKKKPFRKGDTASGTYLTSPVRNTVTQAYLDAMHGCVDPTTTGKEHWIPLQEVEFASGEVQSIMNRAHQLSEWVMTYDRIADRRLLSGDSRRILRYYSSPRSDHNVIISTEIDADKLGARLMSDLRTAIPSETTDKIKEIINAVHKQSASLSGAIVIRGAERVNHAHELLGLVLARHEIEALLRRDIPAAKQKTAWFFIDDFLPWLDIGKPRADILSVNFAVEDDKPLIRIVVGEAKFVSGMNETEQKRHSLEQLENTVAQLTKRLVTEKGTINPLGWRSRISDLVLEHIDPFDHIEGIGFESLINGMRDGSIPITVSGHSIVYVHDKDSDPKHEPIVPDHEIYPAENRRLLAQWVFGRPSIKNGFIDLLDDTAPSRLYLPSAWPFNPYLPEMSVPTLTQEENYGNIEPAEEPTVSEPASPTEASETVFYPSDVTTPIDTELEDSNTDREIIEDKVPEGWLPTVWETLSSMQQDDKREEGEAWLEAQATAFRDALQAEGQSARIIEQRLTPNAAIITLDGTRGVSVSWLERNATDLRTKYGINISLVTPLTMKIAVTINREQRAMLHLADAWMKRKLEGTSPHLGTAVIIGDRELDGELQYLPLFGKFGDIPRAAPHTLISGTTGSGKGILATNMMLDLCAFNSPDNLKLYLVDPKNGVDYGWLEKMPHLEGEIIGDTEHALAVFQGLVAEMENRYATLKEANVANINLYQKLEHQPKPMPRIVLFFDEVANWMQDDAFKENVTSLINQLATKSRAAGIHIVMIYQRADNQVMSMQLRANLGNKLILRLGDEGSSRIALGERGAEKLLGGGHLIAKVDSDEKFYLQVPFLDPEGETQILADAIIRGWKAKNAGV